MSSHVNRSLAGSLLGLCWCATVCPVRAAGASPTLPPSVTAADKVHIAQTVRAYFTDAVAHHPREAYDLLAPCSMVIQLSPTPGAMGLPGRGPYNSVAFDRYRAALIQRVRVTQDATLRRYGLAEALVEGTFRIRLTWPYNGSWGDGHHTIGVIFTHCAGRWQLYDPYYHYYSLR